MLLPNGTKVKITSGDSYTTNGATGVVYQRNPSELSLYPDGYVYVFIPDKQYRNTRVYPWHICHHEIPTEAQFNMGYFVTPHQIFKIGSRTSGFGKFIRKIEGKEECSVSTNT